MGMDIVSMLLDLQTLADGSVGWRIYNIVDSLTDSARVKPV